MNFRKIFTNYYGRSNATTLEVITTTLGVIITRT
nr:MAG TPA: hypothetical protein [Caudoviricetes sp.]